METLLIIGIFAAASFAFMPAALVQPHAAAIAYDQVAERWDALMQFGAKVIGATVPLVLVSIGVWRKIKTRWAERDEETDKRTADAAAKVAATAVHATNSLAQDVKRTIEATVGTDGDGTLRSIVEEQARQLQIHADKAAKFREEIMVEVGSVKRELGTLNGIILRALADKAGI